MEVVSYLSNGLLREGMTAICLETLVLLRREVVHEYPKSVEYKLLEKGRKYNALEVVFGLALPRELCRIVVIGHGRK